MLRYAVGLVLLMLPIGCAQQPSLRTVERVELDRYVGTWYEIARYPNNFERDCAAGTVSAAYTLRPDGRVDVVNRCREVDGETRETAGTARVVDRQTNAKLAVTFFWPFEGDYWIIALDPEYRWVVVGEPARRFLWILSRTPTLSRSVYAEITAQLPALAYDPAKLLISGAIEESPTPGGGRSDRR